jgi:hypothetical protein
MTEELPQAPEGAEEQTEPTGPTEHGGPTGQATGVPAVDGVLADLEKLDELPLEEHLAVFERAHGSLRAALDADPAQSS